ncbi:MAG: ATP synthase F1 subunit delta [Faecalibacterium prausnitzii]|nr:ATP synthase F1 subunit delta [Faecalibacterium prausnitzii]MDD7152799.1 ATP synthase F1 subunit delta [Faecalibacterium prausnitzii]MDY2682467.1 ATP synthase F1 subunit delta [Faecalibacterium prausnitzii]
MTETARMYGGSLYDLAAEEGLETRILGELEQAAQLLKANPDYLRLLSTPSIPKKERCGLLDEALRGQVHLYVLNFLKILCEKGTLRELSGCARAYRLRYNQAHGILEATATSAVPMTAQQTQALHAKLEKLTGKTIDLKTKVDPGVLGGIRLDMEGTELDGTVQNRLAALRRDIASVAL